MGTINFDYTDKIEQIVAFLRRGQTDPVIAAFNHQDTDDTYRMIRTLIENCRVEKDLIPQVVQVAGYVIPQLGSGKRFTCLVRILEVLHESEHLYGKDVYNLLDFSVVRALMPLEIISLANILAGYVNQSPHRLKEVSIWGLVRLIPYMHSINQKEYANEIFQMHSDPQMHRQVLESLTTLIYSMDQGDRSNLIYFFADVFRKNESSEDKFFTIELLEKVTPALPERERLHVAEYAAPLVYFSDTNLVRKAIGFFSAIISLLPSEERFYYTQTVASLINDLSVKQDVIHAIEKSLPFLVRPEEKIQFVDLLKQFRQTEDVYEAQPSLEFDEARLYDN